MSKFEIWIDDDKVNPGSNVLGSDALSTDQQRINGYKAGQDISSIRMNSMLRQNSLVAKALLDISGDNTLDATSNLNDVMNVLKKVDNRTVDFTTPTTVENIVSGETLSTSFGKINKNITDFNTRLTNLGFKMGEVSVVLSGFDTTPPSSASPDSNELFRQGNYVIGELSFLYDHTLDEMRGNENLMPSVVFNNKDVYNSKTVTVGYLTGDFLPKKRSGYRYCSCNYFCKNTTLGSPNIVNLITNVTCSIDDDGKITCRFEDYYNTTNDNNIRRQYYLRKISFGYEAMPITTIQTGGEPEK